MAAVAVPDPSRAEDPTLERRHHLRRLDRTPLPFADISVTVACTRHGYASSVALTFTDRYKPPRRTLNEWPFELRAPPAAPTQRITQTARPTAVTATLHRSSHSRTHTVQMCGHPYPSEACSPVTDRRCRRDPDGPGLRPAPNPDCNLVWRRPRRSPDQPRQSASGGIHAAGTSACPSRRRYRCSTWSLRRQSRKSSGMIFDDLGVLITSVVDTHRS